MLKKQIIAFIDYFYPPFRRIMPEQTFRYAACGGFNTFLDIFAFFISYNYVLHKKVLDLGLFAFKPHIAAFIIAFLVSFPTGFLLMRNVVFTGSILHGRVQLFRYFLLVVVCILLNYVFIKLFVEQFHIFPTIAKMLTTAIVVSFSYVTQKKYTFKTGEAPIPNLNASPKE
ncbi:MAG: phenylalanine 4-monooxygenase [Bacteroidetes bacterium]|nr:MAG: phenylalanine 4-monooxygenase [Bacteroidota bacterium]